ncbi:hypothetical protein P872_09145 [Rhodonellum psychrophilum GCM71 = DSM 17998]|uniref:Uncharacterized protein n=1 Tax=Rhodonellum psychrophilum GCM71 = DSM 17998 TaxID=1123057 RepID=U5BL83_9BACT|nr:hypothetical protein P872_09145 [Rhodonellum psychrophilum GCM71 = DSM 17998]
MENSKLSFLFWRDLGQYPSKEETGSGREDQIPLGFG